MNAEHVKKLLIKGPQRVLIMNAPGEYAADLEALPAGSAVTVWDPAAGPFPVEAGEFDFVQLFVRSASELGSYAPAAIRAVRRDGLLWIAYPKKSGKIKTDISRDAGWEAVHGAGWTGVSLISLDDTWSCMRARPVDAIPTLQRRFEQVTDDGKVVRTADGAGTGGAKQDKPRVVEVPDDFQAALSRSPAAKALFDSIAYTHKKEYVTWITEAKKAETRENRIAKAIEMLESGKKSRMQK
ncbi:YdeI/OmpD-associated family protein [Gordoniibacillus kamchatkensis]|uniref:YdeI/OmpD-associated family protein n=1 Tax=Gordoniibacillus kamchatkensis TaxID=1590651 RepID=UPI000697E2EA|nr:YdeI/OmpD-associated family protein [Paenibacillus sp. VKM B-2647]